MPGVWMFEIAVGFAKTDILHRVNDLFSFYKIDIHQVNVSGDILIISVNGNSRAAGQYDRDPSFLQVRLDVCC